MPGGARPAGSGPGGRSLAPRNDATHQRTLVRHLRSPREDIGKARGRAAVQRLVPVLEADFGRRKDVVKRFGATMQSALIVYKGDK